MKDIKEKSMKMILFYTNMLGNPLHDLKTSQDWVYPEVAPRSVG